MVMPLNLFRKLKITTGNSHNLNYLYNIIVWGLTRRRLPLICTTKCVVGRFEKYSYYLPHMFPQYVHNLLRLTRKTKNEIIYTIFYILDSTFRIILQSVAYHIDYCTNSQHLISKKTKEALCLRVPKDSNICSIPQVLNLFGTYRQIREWDINTNSNNRTLFYSACSASPDVISLW